MQNQLFCDYNYRQVYRLPMQVKVIPNKVGVEGSGCSSLVSWSCGELHAVIIIMHFSGADPGKLKGGGQQKGAKPRMKIFSSHFAPLNFHIIAILKYKKTRSINKRIVQFQSSRLQSLPMQTESERRCQLKSLAASLQLVEKSLRSVLQNEIQQISLTLFYAAGHDL